MFGHDDDSSFCFSAYAFVDYEDRRDAEVRYLLTTLKYGNKIHLQDVSQVRALCNFFFFFFFWDVILF